MKKLKLFLGIITGLIGFVFLFNSNILSGLLMLTSAVLIVIPSQNKNSVPGQYSGGKIILTAILIFTSIFYSAFRNNPMDSLSDKPQDITQSQTVSITSDEAVETTLEHIEQPVETTLEQTQKPVDTTTVGKTTTTEQKTTTKDNKRDFILNTSSMKAHTTKCSSVKEIKENNKKEFNGTVDELKEKGYEPCGRCKPW